MKPAKPSLLLFIRLLFSRLFCPAVALTCLSVNLCADTEVSVEEVFVQGYRASLEKAQAVKKQSTSIVDVVTAEDIGKLPDTSIAESLDRLPGLATQRFNGRASAVSIRGLSGDFSITTLNGREQVSTDNNRGIEFDLYPSELINQVTVYKTSKASLANQGIAGTIDLQTIRPLDIDKRSIVLNARGERNTLGQLNADVSDRGGRASIAYIDKYADETVGLALAVTHLSSPVHENRWNSWGFGQTEDGDLVISGAKPFVRSSELKRDAAMAVLQWEPNERWSSSTDLLYVDFEDFQVLRGMEIPLFGGNFWANNGLSDGVVENGEVISGVYNNAEILGRNDVTIRSAELWAVGQNLKFNFSERWRGDLDVSVSKVRRDDTSIESYSGLSSPDNPGRGTGNGPRDNIGFTVKDGNEGIIFRHDVDYSDPDVLLLGGAFTWGSPLILPSADASDGFVNRDGVEDELLSFRFSLSGDLGGGFGRVFNTLNLGVNYSGREKSRLRSAAYLTLADYPDMVRIDDQYLVESASLDFIGISGIVSYDTLAFYNDGGYVETPFGDFDSASPRATWTVEEDVTSAFVQLDIASEWRGVTFAGDLGVQVVHTDQHSDGFIATPADGGKTARIPNSDGVSYTEILPSVNVSAEIAVDHFLRFGASRSLSRSSMSRINASFGVNFDRSQIGVEGRSPFAAGNGNPQLRPLIADGVDLSYDWYYSDHGYVSLASFHRRLKNWQVIVNEPFDFSNFPVPEDVAGQSIEFTGNYGRWQNVSGGHIQGGEISGVIPAEMLSARLTGFGLQYSATFISSDVKPDSRQPAVQIEGQSDEIYSASVFYQNYGWQTRISVRKRSDFTGRVTDNALTQVLRRVNNEAVYDAQIAYDFGGLGVDYLKGLSIQLQAQNLSNEPFVTTSGSDATSVIDYQEYGRQILLGFTYRL